MINRWNQKNQYTQNPSTQKPNNLKILYRFQLQLDQICLTIPPGCNVFVEWGRKNMRTKAQCRLEKHPNKPQNVYAIKLNQRLILDQKIANPKNSSHQVKENHLKVILEKNGLAKLGGSLKFNINAAVKPNVSEGTSKFSCPLANTPDSKSNLKFLIRYLKLEEVPNFYSSTGSFRSKSPSVVSRSPDSNIKKQPVTSNSQKSHQSSPALVSNSNGKLPLQSPRNISSQNVFPPQINIQDQAYHSNQAYQIQNPLQNPLYNPLQSPRNQNQAQLKISQLMTTITGFKNQLHIKTKEVEMLRDNQKLQADQIQKERIQINGKILKTMTEMNKLEDDFKKLKKQHGLLQVQIEKLKLQLIRSEKAKQRAETELNDFKTKIQTVQNNTEQTDNFLSQQNDRLKYELFQAQSRLFKLQDEVNNGNLNHMNPQNKNYNQYLQHQPYPGARMQELERQNVDLICEMREMEEKMNEYEDRIEELERFSKEKSIEADLLREKLARTQKTSLKEQEFSQSAFAILEQKYDEVMNELTEKREILERMTRKHQDEIKSNEEKIRQKDFEIELMRNKFNSFVQKIDLPQNLSEIIVKKIQIEHQKQLTPSQINA